MAFMSAVSRLPPELQQSPAEVSRGRRPYLHGAVGLQKQVPAADAAVDAAQRHVEAEGEEVAVVEVAHAVVQPGWGRSRLRKERQRRRGDLRLRSKGYGSDGPSSERSWNTRTADMGDGEGTRRPGRAERAYVLQMLQWCVRAGLGTMHFLQMETEGRPCWFWNADERTT